METQFFLEREVLHGQRATMNIMQRLCPLNFEIASTAWAD